MRKLRKYGMMMKWNKDFLGAKKSISKKQNKIERMKSSRNLGVKKAIIKFSPFSKKQKKY